MFCVIVKVNGYIGDDTMVMGPFESRKEAREAQMTAKANLKATGVKSESISTEVKEMVKF